MSGFSLRPARPTDAGSVAAILSGFVDDTDWLPRVHTRAEDLSFAGDMIDRGWVTVAEQPQGIAGFLARDSDLIHALYVHEDARGQGCGSCLLALAQAASDRLSLWTFQANSAAQTFYATHGFSEVERTDGAGNDEGLPDIRMLWMNPACERRR